jgi:hypothetical protein
MPRYTGTLKAYVTAYDLEGVRPFSQEEWRSRPGWKEEHLQDLWAAAYRSLGREKEMDDSPPADTRKIALQTPIKWSKEIPLPEALELGEAWSNDFDVVEVTSERPYRNQMRSSYIYRGKLYKIWTHGQVGEKPVHMQAGYGNGE